jgi:hypothetical protein
MGNPHQLQELTFRGESVTVRRVFTEILDQMIQRFLRTRERTTLLQTSEK